MIKKVTKRGFLHGVCTVVLISGFVLMLGTFGYAESTPNPNWVNVYLQLMGSVVLMVIGAFGIKNIKLF